MSDIVLSLIYFGIALALLILIGIFTVLIARKCRLITWIFFYFTLASVCYVLLQHSIAETYLNFIEGSGVFFSEFFSSFSEPFMFFYRCFARLIISACAGIEGNHVAEFLLEDINDYFLIGLQAGLFLLSALIFRRKKKQVFDNSRYRD